MLHVLHDKKIIFIASVTVNEHVKQYLCETNENFYTNTKSSSNELINQVLCQLL